MDNTRLLVATLLSAIVLVIWGVYLQPAAPPVEDAPSGSAAAGPEPAEGADGTDPTTPDGPSDGSERSSADRSSAEPGSAEPVESAELEEVEEMVPTLDFGADEVVGSREEIVRIDSPRAYVEFSTRGAVLHTYRLKSQAGAEGERLDLVRERGEDLYPFALFAGERGSKLNNVLWQVERGTDADGQKEVRFRHLSEAGAAEKVFRWDESGFMRVEVRVDRMREWGVLLGPGVGDEGGKVYGQTVDRAVGYMKGGESELLRAKDTDEPTFFSAREIDWITLEDNFFLVAAVPLEGVVEAKVLPILQREEAVEGRPRFLPVDTSSSEGDLIEELAIVLQAGSPEMVFDTYFGAKRYSYLKTLPYGLEGAVRWGRLELLAKPLYLLLSWIHDLVVPNWGWAIVIVTFLIRLVFFPLTHKGQKSMSKMQELNPKVKAIRAKYRPKLKDKQGRPNMEAQRQMNDEVMAVYKQAGVNPASGCFPLLLQMPVFFAFYRLLMTAVELRGAEWILWVNDLSDTDMVLPLLMGVTSVASQRMTPASPDPMQRRLMQMMPLMFVVFAFSFPSGLVLYWMTNNCLQMIQQKIINTSREAESEKKEKSGRKKRAEK